MSLFGRDISNVPVLGKGRCYWALVFFRDGVMDKQGCLFAINSSWESKPCKNFALEIWEAFGKERA